MTVEWQIATGSRTAHLIDTTRPAWKNPDGSRRRNGPRSRCGRYPQRNAESPWFSLPAADPGVKRAIATYHCRPCDDCGDLLPGGR